MLVVGNKRIVVVSGGSLQKSVSRFGGWRGMKVILKLSLNL